MTPFGISILGRGSAKPTLRHHTTSQVVSVKGIPYMINCGEGTQPADLEPMLQTHIDFFMQHWNFDIRIHPIDCQLPTLIFTDDHFNVTTFPLDYRVPCYGSLYQVEIDNSVGTDSQLHCRNLHTT